MNSPDKCNVQTYEKNYKHLPKGVEAVGECCENEGEKTTKCECCIKLGAESDCPYCDSNGEDC